MSNELFESKANMDPEWGQLAARLREAYVPEVTEHDVTSLRRRLASDMSGAGHSPRLRHAWAAAAAAAVAAFGIGLVAWGPMSGTAGQRSAAAFQVSLTPAGETMFEFADGRSVHKIVKTTCLEGTSQEAVHFARGQRFVEPNGTPEPGTAVFYRID